MALSALSVSGLTGTVLQYLWQGAAFLLMALVAVMVLRPAAARLHLRRTWGVILSLAMLFAFGSVAYVKSQAVSEVPSKIETTAVAETDDAFAREVGRRVAAMMEQQKPPVAPDRLAAVEKAFREFVARQDTAGLSEQQKQALLVAIDDYAPEFVRDETAAPAFEDRIDTLKFKLWTALKQPPLTPDETLKRDEQRDWMRAWMMRTEEKPGEPSRIQTAAEFERILSNPLSIVYARPIADEQFTSLTATLESNAGLTAAAALPQLTGQLIGLQYPDAARGSLELPFPGKIAAMTPAAGRLHITFRRPRTEPAGVATTERTVDVLKALVAACQAYAKDNDGAWPRDLQQLVDGLYLRLPEAVDLSSEYTYVRPAAASPKQAVVFANLPAFPLEGMLVGLSDGTVDLVLDRESLAKLVPAGATVPPMAEAMAPEAATSTTPVAIAPPARGPRLQFRLGAKENETALIDEVIDPKDPTGQARIRLLKDVILDESAVTTASIVTTLDGPAQVLLEFTPEGRARMAQATAANVGRPLVIMLDGKVVSAPVIRAAITGGRAAITNLGSEEDARAVIAAITNQPESPEPAADAKSEQARQAVEAVQKDLVFAREERAEAHFPQLWAASTKDFTQMVGRLKAGDFDAVLADSDRLKGQVSDMAARSRQARAEDLLSRMRQALRDARLANAANTGELDKALENIEKLYEQGAHAELIAAAVAAGISDISPGGPVSQGAIPNIENVAPVAPMRLQFRLAATDSDSGPVTEVDNPYDRTGQNPKLRVLDSILLDESAVDSARVITSAQGRPQVALRFTDAGRDQFATISEASVGRRLAIIFDNKVLSSPVIQKRIASGQAIISGQYTQSQADILASAISEAAEAWQAARFGTETAPVAPVVAPTTATTPAVDSLLTMSFSSATATLSAERRITIDVPQGTRVLDFVRALSSVARPMRFSVLDAVDAPVGGSFQDKPLAEVLNTILPPELTWRQYGNAVAIFPRALEQGNLKVFTASLQPANAAAMPPEALQTFGRNARDAVQSILFGGATLEAAGAQGRRIWYNPRTLLLSIVDTPENIQKVKNYLTGVVGSAPDATTPGAGPAIATEPLTSAPVAVAPEPEPEPLPPVDTSATIAARQKGNMILTVRLLDSRGGLAESVLVTLWRSLRPGELPPRPTTVLWEPLPGDKASADATLHRKWVPVEHQHARGSIVFKGLAPGDYRVTAAASASAGDPTPLGAGPVVRLDGSRIEEQVRLRLEGDTPLTITTLDAATSSPLAGASLLLRRFDGMPIGFATQNFWTRAGANGVAHFGALVPGRYYLEARKSSLRSGEKSYTTAAPGHSDTIFFFEVESGERNDVEVPMYATSRRTTAAAR